MRLLVTGSRGQLGRALQRAAAAAGHEFVGCDLPELDITDAAAVRTAVARSRPDAVINCAAYTAVDAAESDEARALAVNGAAVASLAAAADGAGARLVQISTDFVFDGAAARAYREDDQPRPISAYGRTKLAGERAAALARRPLIVRTAWLFGDGANFVGAIRRQLDAGARELRVVGDQRGCPTYAADLAEGLLGLLGADAEGIVHVANAGSATWFEFALEIVRQLGAAAAVVPITTAQAARPALRPANSVLDTSRFRAVVGSDLPPWQDALARWLAGRG
ncbi:MAG: dTDP-4-dehydrorhamnose reductase [Thermoanaerobaculaceae bacterium]|nr:dTDP-4-dehydrorhamnose reductase [Thermoanaerobaculaceae bacterium]TAM44479.1 MAG: dTDP-4-dehydrorhamnose reductase [Acidobacteriota bacterium]